MKIVIIEDEEDLGLLISNFLKRETKISTKEGKVTVVVAKTLEEGWEQIATLKPEWILLDNNLPDGKGINQIAEIKAQLQHSRIVMMSAMSNLKEFALSEGADYFLDKPVSLKSIRSILSTSN
jgi:two-component system response regulator CitB